MSLPHPSTARARVNGTDAATAGEVDRVAVYLHAGQVFASSEACEISTVLGSCVAVCLFDPAAHVGGTNHFLLPLHVGGAQASPRYGNVAIAELLARLVALGAHRSTLHAKIFGGATLMNADGARDVTESLGWKNVLVARRVLGGEGIRIIAEDVGGFSGRKLVFHTDAGHAWVKRL